MTYKNAYTPFKPSNSEQRLPPLYYRAAGTELAVASSWGTITPKSFFPHERGLQSENLLPPRGVAASGFRPLRKIPHCCLP